MLNGSFWGVLFLTWVPYAARWIQLGGICSPSEAWPEMMWSPERFGGFHPDLRSLISLLSKVFNPYAQGIQITASSLNHTGQSSVHSSTSFHGQWLIFHTHTGEILIITAGPLQPLPVLTQPLSSVSQRPQAALPSVITSQSTAHPQPWVPHTVPEVVAGPQQVQDVFQPDPAPGSAPTWRFPAWLSSILISLG